jgi:hypothetical protein
MTPNPYQTYSAAGTFGVQSSGYMQGMAQDDPVTRYALAQGNLSMSESVPMWGGVGITETIQPSTANQALGPVISRATATANLTGFAVFDQNFAAVQVPGSSQVPLTNLGGSVMFFRIGSRARIALAIDASVAAGFQNGQIGPQASWDFKSQRIEAYTASPATLAITSVTGSFVAATPGVPSYYNMVVVGAVPITPVTAVGDVISISGATNTGTGGNAAVNGSFYVTSFTDNQNFSFRIPSLTGYVGTIAGTILADKPGGLLPGKIIGVNIGNSKIVTYNSVTGDAVWTPGQSCAIVQI